MQTEAEDAVQEAFLAAFLGLKTLRDAARFRAWIFGIVANVCRYRLRRMREGYFHDLHGGQMVTGFTLEDAQPSAEAIFEIRELHRIVSDAIDELPDDQRQAVTLHYLRGLTLAEIAILTDAPVGSLKARLHRARSKSMLGRATRACSRYRARRLSTSLPRYWRGIRR